MFVAVRRRTAEEFTFLPEQLAIKYNKSLNTAVLTSSLMKDKQGNIIDWNHSHTPEGFRPGVSLQDRAGEQLEGGLHTFYELSPKVADFELVSQQLNDKRLMALSDWYTAQGLTPKQTVGNASMLHQSTLGNIHSLPT